MEEDPNTNWTLNLMRWTKKKLARGESGAIAGVTLHPTGSENTSSAPAPAGKRRRRLSPLPRGDFNVIVCPRQGLAVKNYVTYQFSKAVGLASNGQIQDHQFLVHVRPGSNILVIRTPHQEVADKVRKMTHLLLAGMAYPVNAYVAAPEGFSRGVIHGV
ncbi:hypothetical protein HPB49_017329 [Dermacentor silvarum]|uniref:Uncharacterized protein n=1 Tax=Dermacentor silvarum TaxID=543639 RepID=A0ACB8CYX6_DERSI|nr:hypothetical protein HPB49_017329 [Dermacentor silvarum]